MRHLLLSLILGMIVSCSATAGIQDFILVNETGVDIAGLYISPVAKAKWGEDVLTVDTLSAGEECRIKFSREEKADFWDLMIVDQEGTSLEWPELHLSATSKITLTIENGTPIATYE